MGNFDDYKSAFEQDAARLKQREQEQQESHKAEHLQRLEQRVQERRQSREDARSSNSEQELAIDALVRRAVADAISGAEQGRQQEPAPQVLTVAINAPHTAQVSGNSLALTIHPEGAGAAQPFSLPAYPEDEGNYFLSVSVDGEGMGTLSWVEETSDCP